mmetsp:Transcript_133617/g.415535  ORF Transcript_133617/g.415535 Transcript_133617/m.415535 type:complete len:294 (-) Transcript_133617:466-1347(-)
MPAGLLHALQEGLACQAAPRAATCPPGQGPEELPLPVGVAHLDDIPAGERLVLLREGPYGVVGAEGLRLARRGAAAAPVVALLALEHGHGRDVPAPGADVVQQQRGREEAIARPHRRVHPPRAAKLWPAEEVHALAVDGGVVGSARVVPPLVVEAAPKGDARGLLGEVPHDPLLHAVEEAHDLVIHVIVDNAGGEVAPPVVGDPEVVLVHLRHPASPPGAGIVPVPRAAGVEVRHYKVAAHDVRHLRDDVLVELGVLHSGKELLHLHVQLCIRDRILSAPDLLPEPLLITVVR